MVSVDDVTSRPRQKGQAVDDGTIDYNENLGRGTRSVQPNFVVRPESQRPLEFVVVGPRFTRSVRVLSAKGADALVALGAAL